MKYLKSSLLIPILFPLSAFSNTVAPVNVTVLPTCSLENLSVDIGNYNRTSGHKTSSAIKHKCSPSISYNIALEGDNRRYLIHETNPNEQATAYVWQGTTTNKFFGTGSNVITAVGTGEFTSSPIIIEIPASQNLEVGKYKGVYNMVISY